MRSMSAAEIKSRRQPFRQLPAEGTKLRMLYDFLKENRGIVVEISQPDRKHCNLKAKILNDLQDFWGCDIRSYGKNKHMLAGEWFGPIYKDYTTEKET